MILTKHSTSHPLPPTISSKISFGPAVKFPNNHSVSFSTARSCFPLSIPPSDSSLPSSELAFLESWLVYHCPPPSFQKFE
ncbi:hypothetical protein AYI70_g531 [Smittium culicis]|uniref:Uncharacterized protein n=1 Tax=Smittium culicis TaxID=133412 RepID=A0A1R1YGC8_9FUNG|nr:hypothetical protein AYI70_g531 [Smittium culicis]